MKQYSETIFLTIEDVFGCIDTVQTRIVVKDEVDYFAPNVFSPNGDNVNDQWTIHANPLQVDIISKLMIFDRWGGLLFEANDWPLDSERFAWDGTSNGIILQEGVYVFMAELLLINGKKQMIGGDIMLVR